MKGIDQSKVTFEKEISLSESSVKIRYFESGLPLKAYDFDSDLGKQCAGLQIAVKDLEIVISTLKLSLTLPMVADNKFKNEYAAFDQNNAEHLVLTSLLKSSIITYSKHFTEGKGLTPYFPRKKIVKGLGAELYALHESVINMRNNWVAHGGINDYELAKTVVLVDGQRTGSFTYLHHVHHSQIPSTNLLLKLLPLAEQALIMVKDMLTERTKTLWETEINSMDISMHENNASEYVKFSSQ